MPCVTDTTAPFDRRLVRLRRDRAAPGIGAVMPVLDAVAALLLDRLDDTTRRFHRALDLGGRGAVAPRLAGSGIGLVVSADLSAAMAARAGGLPVAADDEAMPFANGAFDLVVACGGLHWVNDLPGALIQIRRMLAPDGLFLAALPCLPTLGPLRAALAAAEDGLRGGAAPRVSPFPDLRDGAALLQRAGFALPVADRESLDLVYRDPLALLRDLRGAGEQSALRARDMRTPPRALFGAALAGLPQPLRPVLDLVVLTGWAPDPATQSRPARPGSATVRLADALGTTERPAGEATAPREA
jgi:NADH dehydrogenase [ubiquinone] 1 alpha subcomplex assembly factor 5